MLIQKKEIDHAIFAKKYHGIAFAVDGTLRQTIDPSSYYPVDNNWIFRPNVPTVIHNYYTPVSNVRYALLSEQPWISVGELSYHVAWELLKGVLPLFQGRNVDMYMCEHSVNSFCACHKPSPYFLLRFAFTRHLKLTEILYVGDMYTDFVCADRAGVDFAWSLDFFGA
jgi:histidinol phosphatase-like enzyme